MNVTLSPEERLSLLRPVETLFSDIGKVTLSAFFYTLCRNGCEIYQSKIGTRLEVGTRVRLSDPNGQFFALGEVQKFEEGTAVKAIKLFRI